MTGKRIYGVFCAAITPIQADYRPDGPRLAAHCQQLLDDGCHGVAVLGTTGEANSFSALERMTLLEAVRDAEIEGSQLLPGTGTCSVAETVALTRHALSLGIEQAVVLPPYYYKAPSEDGLFAFYAQVIEAIADDRFKLVLYHIPQMTAVPITPSLIARLIATFPGTIAGVKDSSGDFKHMAGLARDFPDLAIFAGADPLMLPLLKAGGAGCITATSNLVADSLRLVFDRHDDAVAAKEVAAAAARIDRFRNESNRFPQIPTIRAMLARRYADDSWLLPRAPHLPLSADQRAALDWAALPL